MTPRCHNRCMLVSAEVLRTHLDYTAWASQRLIAAAAQLSPEHLHHDFGTAHRDILETLVHIFAADRIWLARLTGAPQSVFVTDSDRSLTFLQDAWPQLHNNWKEWARSLRNDSVSSALTYKDLKGNEWTQPLWQLVLHVVNHGSHHRGQVSGFLRSLGHTPPILDLVYYYRELIP